ncbi:FAD:protein FMN transferase [bacterium]|nr:FAD:protein FMN transferase [bacterium]
MKIDKFKFFIILIAGLLAVVCSPPQKEPVKEIRFLMDTVVQISIYDYSKSEDFIQQAVDKAFQAIVDVEKAASIHLEGSELSELIRRAGIEPSKLSDDMVFLLSEAIAIGDKTDGYFDCTIGAVKKLWPFLLSDATPPDSTSILKALHSVDYSKIQIKGNNVFLPQKAIEIDLGGVAKGLAIDKAVASLRSCGISAGIVDAGGDLRTFGRHPYMPNWGIGIRNPRAGQSSLYAVLRLDSAAVATSGDYERYFEFDGERYHHLLNPFTGYPARGCVSVTVVAPEAMLADAYATAIFIMGPKEGMTFLENNKDIEGMIVYFEDEKLVHCVSKGLRESFEFLGG